MEVDQACAGVDCQSTLSDTGLSTVDRMLATGGEGLMLSEIAIDSVLTEINGQPKAGTRRQPPPRTKGENRQPGHLGSVVQRPTWAAQFMSGGSHGQAVNSAGALLPKGARAGRPLVRPRRLIDGIRLRVRTDVHGGTSPSSTDRGIGSTACSVDGSGTAPGSGSSLGFSS